MINIPTPARDIDKDFPMPVEDDPQFQDVEQPEFRVERGIKVNEEVEVVGIKETNMQICGDVP